MIAQGISITQILVMENHRSLIFQFEVPGKPDLSVNAQLHVLQRQLVEENGGVFIPLVVESYRLRTPFCKEDIKIHCIEN